MEKINFSYIADKNILNDGIKLSGLYNPINSRRIIFSLLMSIVIANSVYGTVNLKEITFRNAFYFAIALIIIAVVWLEPRLQVKNHIKYLLSKEVEVTLESNQIAIRIGNENLTIKKDNLKGFRDQKDYIIIYFSGEYLLLPKSQKSPEEIEATLNILDNFHSIEKEVQ